MRILHVITGMQKAAGTSVFCGEVCNGLVALGHDVAIAVTHPDAVDCYPLDPRVKLISITSLLHSPTPSLPYFNLVHIHGLWSGLLHRAAAFARQNKIPVVWSTHGMTAPWSMRHKWWKKWLPWYLYQKRDLRNADIVHSTSEKEREWNWDLGFSRQVLAPLGTNLVEFSSDHDRHGTGRVLLYVGRVYPVKALDRLIEAFAQVNDRSHWSLRIVGPDQSGHMVYLQSIVSTLGLEGRVIFTGPKYGQDLELEYRTCDGLALVSHTENFGATVVDAMAYGKPVITSTNTPWKEVSEIRAGWWVDNEVAPLSRALGELMSMDDRGRALMGERGRELVGRKYTWMAVAKTLIGAYEKLFGDNSVKT